MSNILTPEFRVHHPQIEKPHSYTLQDGTETKPVYSVLAVWDEAEFDGDGFAELRAELDSVCKGVFKKPYAKIPSTVRKPFRPGSDKESICSDDEIFASLKANVSHPPTIVAEDRSLIQDPQKVLAAFPAGCKARAVVHVWANKHVVGLNLVAIQVTDRHSEMSAAKAEAALEHFGVVDSPAGELEDDDSDIPF